MSVKVNLLIERIGAAFSRGLGSRLKADLLMHGPSENHSHMVFLFSEPIETESILSLLIEIGTHWNCHTSRSQVKNKTCAFGTLYPDDKDTIGVHYGIFNNSEKGLSVYVNLSPCID